MRKELLQIYNHFGEETQAKKRIEEINELNEAVAKGEVENIVEEIADVLVLVNQLLQKYDVDIDELWKIIDQKINRTLERIESEYYEKGEE